MNAALGEEPSEVKKAPTGLKPLQQQEPSNQMSEKVKTIANGNVGQMEGRKNSAFIDDNNNNKLKMNNQTKETKPVSQGLIIAQNLTKVEEPPNGEVKTRILQPTPFQARVESETMMTDGVRHKFVSNETIGAKGARNEFYDMPDPANSKFGKCTKCIKCCYVM